MKQETTGEDMTAFEIPIAQGGCLCGAVRFRVTRPLREVINCHCGQCRRAHGNFAAYTAVDSDGLELLRHDGLKWYRSSDSAERGFCKQCGASLFWKPTSRDYVSISAGALDAPTGLRTAAHIFCDDAGDYYEIADQLPRYPGTMGGAKSADQRGG